jgi:segregation and condensation protein A
VTASSETTLGPAPEETAALPDEGGELLRINLDQFEGPFEVLLYLIRAQEIDIFDIPIKKITAQYLGFLEQLRGQNLDIASEFIVMAATLIQIKSRMILPLDVPEEEEEEIEEEDPRLELVEKLLEYRRFRDLARALGDRGEVAAEWYGRRVKLNLEPMGDDDEEDYIEVDINDLYTAIRAMLRFVLAPPVHEVQGEGASVDEKIGRIENCLEERESVTWSELLSECRSRVEVVCCLLAILELCRMRRIRAHQHRLFGEIRLFARPVEEHETPPSPDLAPEI